MLAAAVCADLMNEMNVEEQVAHRIGISLVWKGAMVLSTCHAPARCMDALADYGGQCQDVHVRHLPSVFCPAGSMEEDRGLDKQKGQGGWKRRRQEKIGSPGDQRRELMPRVLD